MTGPELPSRPCDSRVFSCAGIAALMLGLMLISNAVGVELFHSWKWYGVIVGVALMLAAIFFHSLGKRYKGFYLVSLLLNGIGNGCSLSALYIDRSLSASVMENLPGLLPGICLLLLGALLLAALPIKKKAALWICGLLAATVIAGCCLGILKTDGQEEAHWRFAMFGALLAAMFLVPMGMISGNQERSLLRYASFAGFGAYILITLIVVLVISEGEALDGLDLPFGGSSGKRPKPKRRQKWP